VRTIKDYEKLTAKMEKRISELEEKLKKLEGILIDAAARLMSY